MLSTKKALLNLRMLQDVQILVVDNDRDSRDLYTFLLEDRGAAVTASASIQDALNCLNACIPNLLICEIRFLGESVLPLIQQVRSLTLCTGRPIPILATSTCSPISLVQQLAVKVEAYLLKPIDIDDFIEQSWDLTRAPKPAYQLSYRSKIQAWAS